MSNLARRLAVASIGGLGVVAGVGLFGHHQLTRKVQKLSDHTLEAWRLPEPTEIVGWSRDGKRIHARLFAHRADRPSIIVSHGHGGNWESVLPVARLLIDDYNVALVDMRGHGDSEGERTTIGWEERLDVIAIADELNARGLGPIGVVGFSMGGAASLLAAADDERIQVVVSDSSYSRLYRTVAVAAVDRGYPRPVCLPVAWLACAAASIRHGWVPHRLDPAERIAKIAPRPILLVHGALDQLTRVDHAHELKRRAGDNAELWIHADLGHCRTVEDKYHQFGERVRGFLARALG